MAAERPDARSTPPRLPLSGVRVVDFTQVVAGPHCTLWLASLGAEVLKIEAGARPDSMRHSQVQPGEPPSMNRNPLFAVTNMLKKSVALNVASPRGAALCKQLVAQSDVVVESFSPGVLDRFGLGYEELRKVNPGIVMASLSGYGHSGAYAGFLAYAPNIQAFCGLSSATGYRNGPPEQIFLYYADIPSGQMMVLGILAALKHRRRTGKGQYIDVAMSQAMISLAPLPAIHFAYTGRNQLPNENRDELMAPHGCYPCAGRERWLAVAVDGEAQWGAFGEVLGHPEWTADARFGGPALRRQNHDELDVLISEATRQADVFELAERLQARGVAAAACQNAKDLLEDPQLAARGYFVSIDQPDLGQAMLPRIPWQMSYFEALPYGPAPAFGAHTDDVAHEILGLSEAEIEELRNDHVLG